MPNFDYLCDKEKGGCGALFEIWNEPAVQTRPCKYCGVEAILFWRTMPGMSPDPFWGGSYHPSLGHFHSRDQMKQMMKDRNLMLDEPGIESEIKRNRESRLQKELAPIREGIHKKLGALTYDQKVAAFESSKNGSGFVMHPSHSPAGVPVTQNHIDRIVGGQSGD